MQQYLRKYGVQTILNFVLYEVDGVDFRVDAVDAGADCTLRKDQGADTTNVNDFVDEGIGYSITLTATEMEFAEGLVHIIDSATKQWLDETLKIETYGNASAQHAQDFDTTVPTVGEIQAEMEENGASLLDTIRDNIGTPANIDSGGATLSGNLKKLADDNAGATFDATTDSLNKIRDDRTLPAADYVVVGDTIAAVTLVNGLAADVITAAAIAAAAIDNATFAADVGSTAYATNIIALAVRKALDDYDAATKAEMDTGHGLLATEAKQDIIDTNVDQIETSVITNAAGTDVAADIIAIKAETATIVTDTNEMQGKLPSSSYLKGSGDVDGGMDTNDKADVNSEVNDVLSTDTQSIPGQGAPTTTPTLVAAIMYLYKRFRNKYTQTATEGKLFADNDSTVDQKSTVSDDTTTFTKGKFGTGA